MTSVPAVMEMAGLENYEGIVSSTTLCLGDPSESVQAFAKRYKAEYNQEISPTHVNHYDSVYIIKSIVEKVGVDREKIREALAALKDYKGAVGTYSADSEGNLVHYMYTQVYENGQWVLLDKEEYPFT